LGLEGELPEKINVSTIESRLQRIKQEQTLDLNKTHPVPFNYSSDLLLHRAKVLPQHPNGLRFSLFSPTSDLLIGQEYFSIGGGFVQPGDFHTSENVFYRKGTVDEEERKKAEPAVPFNNATHLLEICKAQGVSIADIVWQNEMRWRGKETIREETLKLWQVMEMSIQNGLNADDTKPLPGGLNVRRRAPGLYRRLQQNSDSSMINSLDRLSCYAIAVNEENAGGGRVVTAPTNGAAGIIPAVLKYYLDTHGNLSKVELDGAIIRYLHTAAAIGMLYKRGASISAAEVGCQGEVGVAASMAAAALTALHNGTLLQVENAAEIAMEHSLGLTCDPIGGLVQIPCIERNAVGAAKAVTAAQLALNGDGKHLVTLDSVIETMRQTGEDMQSKYKETSLGGLAVNFTLC
jgi:iron-sulfur-dependent L-serine dehydratase single chain form